MPVRVRNGQKRSQNAPSRHQKLAGKLAVRAPGRVNPRFGRANACRSGAASVAITHDGANRRITVSDDGRGIGDPRTLLAFGKSGWPEAPARGRKSRGHGHLLPRAAVAPDTLAGRRARRLERPTREGPLRRTRARGRRGGPRPGPRPGHRPERKHLAPCPNSPSAWTSARPRPVQSTSGSPRKPRTSAPRDSPTPRSPGGSASSRKPSPRPSVGWRRPRRAAGGLGPGCLAARCRGRFCPAAAGSRWRGASLPVRRPGLLHGPSARGGGLEDRLSSSWSSRLSARTVWSPRWFRVQPHEILAVWPAFVCFLISPASVFPLSAP